MATTSRQDQSFLNDVIGTGILGMAIDWIANNLSPDEVFSEKQLTEWAQNSDVDDIFTNRQLSHWAEDNGFVKSD